MLRFMIGLYVIGATLLTGFTNVSALDLGFTNNFNNKPSKRSQSSTKTGNAINMNSHHGKNRVSAAPEVITTTTLPTSYITDDEEHVISSGEQHYTKSIIGDKITTNVNPMTGNQVIIVNSLLSEQEFQDQVLLEQQRQAEEQQRLVQWEQQILLSSHGNNNDHSDSANNFISPLATSSSPSYKPSRSPSYAPTAPPNEILSPPDCIQDESELVYVNGQLSFLGTFQKCLSNIADPQGLPTIYNGSVQGIMNVYTNIQINNLHTIDAVAGSATLDFYLRLYWRDNRFNMPLFWSKCSSTIQKNGLELTLVVDNGELMWLPDIRFHDVASIESIVGTLRLNSTNVFFWSRHIVATYMQPTLEFEQYPSDDQFIHIRYGSYAYSQSFFKLLFISPAISLNQNYDKSYTLLNNPLWQYDAKETTYEQYLSGSNFLNVIYHLRMKRISQGIVVRLILPITMLIVIGGLVFWADPANRVDSTITLLLAVSALYIVILANIPMLGYLTAIDRYVFLMFIVLSIATVVHQVYATLNEKTDRWPLRIFYLRVIEALGRVTIFPIAALLLMFTIDRLSDTLLLIIYIITFPVNGLIFLRECVGCYYAFQCSYQMLVEKIQQLPSIEEEEEQENNQNGKEGDSCAHGTPGSVANFAIDDHVKKLSWMEVFIYNYFHFNIVTSSRVWIMMERRTLVAERRAAMLKKLQATKKRDKRKNSKSLLLQQSASTGSIGVSFSEDGGDGHSLSPSAAAQLTKRNSTRSGVDDKDAASLSDIYSQNHAATSVHSSGSLERQHSKPLPLKGTEVVQSNPAAGQSFWSTFFFGSMDDSSPSQVTTVAVTNQNQV